MSQAAKQGDQIVPVGVHLHVVKLPSPAPPGPLAHPCVWEITKNLSADVFIHSQAAAMKDSGGENTGAKKHAVTKPGLDFLRPPPNMDQAAIADGSRSVFINKRPAARAGDPADTCHEAPGAKTGSVVIAGTCTVFIGG
jgi:uncharacterized Zn-binding protein involved in type VI secretion